MMGSWKAFAVSCLVGFVHLPGLAQEMPIPARLSTALGFPPTIPVITYHDVSYNSHVQENVPPETFAAHLDFIRENGFTTIFASEYVKILRNELPVPERAVVLAFDDQHVGVVRNAVPLLEERGMRATFFIVAGSVSETAPWYQLTWSQLTAPVERGTLEVQSHSYEHVDLTQADDETLRVNLVQSRETIETQLNVRCTLVAYPYGTFDSRVKRVAESVGYEAGFTIGPVRLETDPIDLFALKRVGIWAEMPESEFRWRLCLDLLPPLQPFSAIQELSWRSLR